MLHYIQIFTSTCEDTMQVKREIHVGETLLHKLPIIYNEYMCLCWVCTLSCMICCLFSICYKNLYYIHGFDFSITFYLRCRCATFLGARTHRVALISAIYRDRGETDYYCSLLWMSFSFNWRCSDSVSLVVTREKGKREKGLLCYL